MADRGHVTNGNNIEFNGENIENESSAASRLRSFITRAFQEQTPERLQSEEAGSEERTAKFLERALSESQRMEKEVTKSQRKQQQLYAELGAKRFQEWTMEHADAIANRDQAMDVDLER